MQSHWLWLFLLCTIGSDYSTRNDGTAAAFKAKPAGQFCEVDRIWNVRTPEQEGVTICDGYTGYLHVFCCDDTKSGKNFHASIWTMCAFGCLTRNCPRSSRLQYRKKLNESASKSEIYNVNPFDVVDDTWTNHDRFQRWKAENARRFTTSGRWNCFGNPHHEVESKNDFCRRNKHQPEWWYDMFRNDLPDSFENRSADDGYERNRHWHVQHQTASFSKAFRARRFVERSESAYNNLAFYQLYHRAWEPVMIPCYLCDPLKIASGLGKRFYVSERVRNVFMENELFHHFLEAHEFLIRELLLRLPRTYGQYQEMERLLAVFKLGQQNAKAGGLLMPSQDIAFGTFFYADNDMEMPEVVTNIDVLVHPDHVHPSVNGYYRNFDLPLRLKPFDWIYRNCDLHWLEKLPLDYSENDTQSTPKLHTKRPDWNLFSNVSWSEWSCGNGCTDHAKQMRTGLLSIKKFDPDRTIRPFGRQSVVDDRDGLFEEWQLLNAWLSVSPYREQGIPVYSSLLWSLQTGIQQCENFFPQQNASGSLGEYYQISSFAVVVLAAAKQRSATFLVAAILTMSYVGAAPIPSSELVATLNVSGLSINIYVQLAQSNSSGSKGLGDFTFDHLLIVIGSIFAFIFVVLPNGIKYWRSITEAGAQQAMPTFNLQMFRNDVPDEPAAEQGNPANVNGFQEH